MSILCITCLLLNLALLSGSVVSAQSVDMVVEGLLSYRTDAFAFPVYI